MTHAVVVYSPTAKLHTLIHTGTKGECERMVRRFSARMSGNKRHIVQVEQVPSMLALNKVPMIEWADKVGI